MKKFVGLIMLLLIAVSLCGCSKKVESITLSNTTLELRVDETAVLSTIILPTEADEQITWVSANEAVATVDDSGVVTAHSVGSTSIVVSAKSGAMASCAVVVKEKTAYDRLSAESQWFVDNFKKKLDSFKKPDSVLIKGVAYDSEKNRWYIKVDAQNSFGDYRTAYYEMYDDGAVLADVLDVCEFYYILSYSSSYSMNQELDLINEALHE